MPPRPALVNVMVKAAEKAAKGLVRDFGEVENLQISRKGPGDFVSAADMKAQKTLREELGKARPSFGFLMEENDGAADTSATSERWIVDPLDGTTNFLHGVPHWAISIAAEREGEIIAGVIYDPIKDELFWAEKGLGAFLNSRRLRVSIRKDLSECLAGTGLPFKGKPLPNIVRQLETIMPKVAGVRRAGAAALDMAYVAAGRFDFYWEHKLGPWDLAAGVVLVKEAGGFVSAFKEKENPVTSGSVIATNAALHAEVVDTLRACLL